MGEAGAGQVWGRGGDLPPPLHVRHSPQIPACPPTQKPSKPSTGVIDETCVIDETLGHWWLNPTSAPPPHGGQGVGGKISTCNPVIVSLASCPHP